MPLYPIITSQSIHFNPAQKKQFSKIPPIPIKCAIKFPPSSLIQTILMNFIGKNRNAGNQQHQKEGAIYLFIVEMQTLNMCLR